MGFLKAFRRRARSKAGRTIYSISLRFGQKGIGMGVAMDVVGVVDVVDVVDNWGRRRRRCCRAK